MKISVFISDTEQLHYTTSRDYGRWEVCRFVIDESDNWKQRGTWSITSFELVQELVKYVEVGELKCP